MSYNEISKEVECAISGEKLKTWGLSNANDGSLTQKAELIMSDLQVVGFLRSGYKRPQVLEFIQTLASESPYNPIRDYFVECGALWDGVDRLEDLFATVELTNVDQKADYQIETVHMFIRKWLIQVAAAACRGSHKFEKKIKHFNRVLVFVGAQGIGKTKWVQALFPGALQDYCLGAKNLSMSSFRGDRVKTIMEITNTLICNINEIDKQFTDNNYAEFKDFLDTDEDILVLPYGRMPVRRIRRTVFIGSTNTPKFLTDPTGNRRIELIHCDKLESQHDIDLDQLWGQIYNIYKSGERWWFEPQNPADKLFIQERDRLNMGAMKVHSSSFVEYLSEIYDPSQPKEMWSKATFIMIRTQVSQYLAQDRNVDLRNRFSSQKQDLVNWLKQYHSQISETSGLPGARVWYWIPPIREELASAEFFGDSDKEIIRKLDQKPRRVKYMKRKKREEEATHV